ncbi:MAG: tetratricopeptide repeat protein [Moorea sp. SIO2B7]|nr:tetratricopeptide repeat protein [Moorena sp. SIO2B7]
MNSRSQIHIAAFLILGLLGQPILGLMNLGVPIVLAQTVPIEVRRGYTLLGKPDVKAAIAAFQQALKRYPQSLEAKLGLAIAYKRQGEDDQAWVAYLAVIEQDPNNEIALRNIGEFGVVTVPCVIR